MNPGDNHPDKTKPDDNSSDSPVTVDLGQVVAGFDNNHPSSTFWFFLIVGFLGATLGLLWWVEHPWFDKIMALVPEFLQF